MVRQNKALRSRPDQYLISSPVPNQRKDTEDDKKMETIKTLILECVAGNSFQYRGAPTYSKSQALRDVTDRKP